MGFRVKGGVVMCPAVAEGQHLDTPLAAACTPTGRGVYTLEEGKEIVLGQTIQLVLVLRFIGQDERQLLIVTHHWYFSF